MRFRSRKFLCVLAILAFPVASARAADDTAYVIQFARPNNVGQKFNITAKCDLSDTSRTELDGKEEKKESTDSKYEINGVKTILAVDDNGVVTKFHLVIDKFTASEGAAAAAEILKPGDELDCTYKDGKTEFTRKTGEFSKAAQNALDTLFPSSGKKSDDELFGTPDKKKVGESWPINSTAIIQLFSGEGMKADPKNAKGTVKLTGTTTLSNIPSLALDTRIDIKLETTGITVESMGKAKDFSMTMTGSAQRPIDPSNPSSFTQAKIKIHTVFEEQQQGATKTTTADQTDSRELTEILIK